MTTDCRCDKCRAACERIPGLFTPEQAQAAIAAGLGIRLMAIGYHDDRGTYRALAPLSVPLDGIYHPTAISPHLRLETASAKGRCTFLTADRDCEIHTSGFKPAECATALLCVSPDERERSNAAIRDAWAMPDGRRIVEQWSDQLSADGTPKAGTPIEKISWQATA